MRGVKLSDQTVIEVRTLYAMDCYQKDIAEQYGLHKSAVSNICRNINYRKLPTAWDIWRQTWKI